MKEQMKEQRNLRWSLNNCIRKLWDWTALNICFGRKIKLSDIDGFVEVNYHFLFLEGKSKRAKMERGQRQALERLAGVPKIIVILVRGDPPDITTVDEWEVLGNSPQTHQGNFQDFADFIRAWFLWADRGGDDKEKN